MIKEYERCLFCMNEDCTSACKKGGTPAKFLRSLYFGNVTNINADCENCETVDCEKACLRGKIDYAVHIKDLAKNYKNSDSPIAEDETGISLETNFCGIKCENPFFLSSSVVASDYEMCARALKMGWGGIVYKTIGLGEIKDVSPRFGQLSNGSLKGFRNLEQISDKPAATDFEILKRLKKDFPEKVICASIMGQNEAEWAALARQCEMAGVDLIELNFSCPHMKAQNMGSDVGTDTELVERFTAAVRGAVNLPILAKMTPNLTDVAPSAKAAMKGGATGIAAINTIKSLTGFLSEKDTIDHKTAISGYSGRNVKPIALRFICDIAKALPGIPISGMGGIENAYDSAEFFALGCANVQITTAVMEYGYRIIDDLTLGLKNYLITSGYKNLDEFIGSSIEKIESADNLNRESLVYPVFERDKCIGCGRCAISCSDGGHGAIEFDKNPKLIGGKCVGCHLCRLVCPADAVSVSKRVTKEKVQ
jgi:dihydropyrimidine dehydrogenase (NAD+) subunit PreA